MKIKLGFKTKNSVYLNNLTKIVFNLTNTLGFVIVLGSNVMAELDTKACSNTKNSMSTIQNRDGAQKISSIDYKKGMEIFNKLKNPKYKIPYLDAEKNCEARAHLISEILYREFKLSTVKVFVQSGREDSENISYGATGAAYLEGDESNNTMLTPTSALTGQEYSWDYHTASALCLNKDGKSELYVLDPSFFNKPVTFSVWNKAITSGLAKDEYSTYTTSMFNISRLDNPIESPRHAEFKKDTLAQIQKQLYESWKEHTRLKLLKTPKIQYNRGDEVGSEAID